MQLDLLIGSRSAEENRPTIVSVAIRPDAPGTFRKR
jgi:hypothetical protein